MLPILKEQAEAVKKSAEFGTMLIAESGNLARYMGKVLGTIPEDTVGLILGDPLHAVRTIIAGKLDGLVTTTLKDRGVEKTEGVSPSLAIPLLRAAYDESRPELQAIWAGLIAAAMDPQRSDRVRRSFIDTVKAMDPLDALILQTRYKDGGGNLEPNARDFISRALKISTQETEVSLDNLRALKCIGSLDGVITNFWVTAYGKELMRACLT